MKNFISILVQEENGDVRENLINKNHIIRVIPTYTGSVRLYLTNKETPLICEDTLIDILKKM